jgi:gluconate 5-dehydrogenase
MNRDSNPSIAELFDLSGRVSVVTGGGGHLGRAIASALAEAGSRVIVTSRDAARAAAVAATLLSHDKLQHLGLALDHTDASSIDHFIEQAVAAAGRIDVLVNNGHDKTSADWSTASAEEFTRQLANATGYFLLARHVRDDAVRRKASASIIMLGSMYGLVGSYPDAYADNCPASPVAYHTLKGGILQLTRHLAVYWARDNVRVNSLSPGPFPADEASAQLVERLKSKSPTGRIGRPHELKGAVLLLASDAGSYITGHNLVVDGGWTSW